MIQSRRDVLAAGSIGLGLLGRSSAARSVSSSQPTHQDYGSLEMEVQEAFADLPERKAFKIWAPATEQRAEFLAQLHNQERLFTASTNKAIILCERLRQLDLPNIASELTRRKIKLDRTVWSVGSTVFNPPELSGIVSERTAMEAMISHSDNTATDIVLKQTGAYHVRQFIASIGLKSTMIPDSTRALFAYLLGAPNYRTITWEELQMLSGPFAHPPLNDVETLASTADDLVSFFSRALAGKFFKYEQTLRQLRRILLLGDITELVPFPLGASVFGKAGYFDIEGEHGYCIAGGMYFPDRWVYFAFILNWDAMEANDPATVKAFYGAIRKAIELVQNGLGN